MNSISDAIENMILEAFAEEAEEAIVQRNDLAEKLNCAPSHISYVLQTRFTPAHGFFVDSRRGRGGVVRIVRKELPDTPTCYDVLQMMRARGRLTGRETRLLDFAMQNLPGSDLQKQRFLSTAIRIMEGR